jgi:selenoprotein W-related protein
MKHVTPRTLAFPTSCMSNFTPTNYWVSHHACSSYNEQDEARTNRMIPTIELCRFFLFIQLSIQYIHAFTFHVIPKNLKLSRSQTTIWRRCISASYSSRRELRNFVSAKVSKDSNNDLLPRVSIEYCTGCKWMLRAAWISQELLTTFQDELHSVSLVPSKPPSPAGTFVITLNDDITIWSRKDEGRFPEAKEVKQRIRDVIRPDKSLGHSDTKERKSVLAGGQDIEKWYGFY